MLFLQAVADWDPSVNARPPDTYRQAPLKGLYQEEHNSE